MILGYLENEREFADLVLDAFAEPEEAGRERTFERIGEALAGALPGREKVRPGLLPQRAGSLMDLVREFLARSGGSSPCRSK